MDLTWQGHVETSTWRQWNGEQNKTSELMGRSGVEQRKIDDLMEVWRQWAGRRGIREAGSEGQDEIRQDDQWTPTPHVLAWQVIKAIQKKSFYAPVQLQIPVRGSLKEKKIINSGTTSSSNA